MFLAFEYWSSENLWVIALAEGGKREKRMWMPESSRPVYLFKRPRVHDQSYAACTLL